MTVKQSPAWQALEQHYKAQIETRDLRQLFEQQVDRFSTMSMQQPGLLLDLSKQRLDQQTLKLLISLAEQQDLAAWIKQLFAGEAVNSSEGRAALHTALRAPRDLDSQAEGVSVTADVHANLDKMAGLVEKIHNHQWRGFSGKPITDVVNLGVGGSDLGPQMVCHALEEFRVDAAADLRIHFVSSIDGSQLAELLKHLNQETTLFILSSKSFTTIDTLANADTARGWLEEKIDNPAILRRQHFIGSSANPQKMTEWGIDEANQLQFWDWVGGRYSLWSVIGLPIALLIGMQGFRQLLAGAHQMDQHFQTSPAETNLPVLLALVGIWNHNFLGSRGHAVLPYDGRLKYFPHYLTQLEMESNGKSVNRDGERVDYDTCPIIWGEVGPNAQHAFYQLLHQGTQPVSCDFIAPVVRYQQNTAEGTADTLRQQQSLTLANCLAQSRVLMLGDHALSHDERRKLTRNDQRYPGNQPSSTLLLQELTPFSLGQLLALYEHKVFVQSVIWEINPFDQWGVELGKQIANKTRCAIDQPDYRFGESSTDGLLDYISQIQSDTQGTS
ncbi:glucose-6-phosphate isomerase [Motiliproteus sp.]|uniref:glucose-6-phosphate isomerase n=1 Tax=Motiliproteus sp. TaxID=1898955 RepID=UPI003BA86E46